ncbi:Protein-L-isoaspartate O-methyltransferase [Platanthera guangdongensis]|uniref:Protein-L-isoaspartate O-methyltransferase n=1 Tax=Platanthera guangdongensis TaxID=2320717 RepID=A0ABR2M7U1_9ASPA
MSAYLPTTPRFLNSRRNSIHLAAVGSSSSSRSRIPSSYSFLLRPLASSSSSDEAPNYFPDFCPLLRMEVLRSSYNQLFRATHILLLFTISTNFFAEKGFMTKASLEKNKGLVENLCQYGVIKSKKVAEMMETIDRGLFVPYGSQPYSDSPMPIGYNATISAPHMHATCLELLKDHLKPGMRALDVGSGTGYLTACFAMMVGPDGHAIGVEHIPELGAASIKNIKRSAAEPLMRGGSLSVHVADGRLGWPELAPYDTIHVGAAASEVPKALLDQLKPGGRIVIPVGNFFQELKVIDKNPDGSVATRTDASVRYVPLTSRSAQLHEL